MWLQSMTGSSSPPNPQRVKRTKLIALIVSLSALCVGTNYAMISLSNVKLMDSIVFTTSVVFGYIPGALVAVLSWLVYGTLNPLGFSAPVLATVALSETIYSWGGHLVGKTPYGRRAGSNVSMNRSLVFGSIGLFCTLMYDLVTNAVSGLLAYNSVWIGWATMNFPFPLGIIHESSNFLFFASVIPILLKVMTKAVPTFDI